MSKIGTTANIVISEVSSRVMVAKYSEFYSLNAAAVALNNYIVVIDPRYYPSQGKKFKWDWNKRI